MTALYHVFLNESGGVAIFAPGEPFLVVTALLTHCIERWPRLEVILDKRYTHEHLRQKLEWYIREEIADIPGQVVVIRQEESAKVKALQAADYVAWATRQKYQAEDRSYYQLIRSRVVAEEVIEAK
jgi:hypothetical protein